MRTPRQKPVYLEVKAENIPEELKEVPQWVLWRGEWNGKKWTKVPYQPNGYKANKKKPEHWCDFSQAIDTYLGKRDLFDGIGICLTESDPFTALDLDRVVSSSGIITPEAQQIIYQINSYTEYSPSGKGIRIFCKGRLERNRKSGTIEAYWKDWYLTVTGWKLGEVKI